MAQYRAGNWTKAVSSLEKSMDLNHGVDANNSFFLAMAHWQLAKGETASVRDRARHRQEARTWYDRAVTGMEKNQPKNEELIRFRAEAEELMGIQEPRPKSGRKGQRGQSR